MTGEWPMQPKYKMLFKRRKNRGSVVPLRALTAMVLQAINE